MSMLAPELTFGTPDTISNDQGYFGPETITWRIHSDVMAVVGGVRALFLQALEPELLVECKLTLDIEKNHSADY